MSDLPVFTLEDLERMPRFELPSFDNDVAVSLGEVAVEVIRDRRLNLAVRIMVSGDVVFVAKLGTTGPGDVRGFGARRSSPSISASPRFSSAVAMRPRALRSRTATTWTTRRCERTAGPSRCS